MTNDWNTNKLGQKYKSIDKPDITICTMIVSRKFLAAYDESVGYMRLYDISVSPHREVLPDSKEYKDHFDGLS